MEATIKIINEMRKKKVIGTYAIGGAVAMIFYVEPVLTYDLDVFVFLPQTPGRLITISPIYEYLKEKGYKPHKEHIVIEGVPVQFIPAYNKLVEEAVNEARETKYNRVKIRVLQPEHLLAIMLETDRPKDRTRITQLFEQAKINVDYLSEILERHRLTDKWREFQSRFYENQ